MQSHGRTKQFRKIPVKNRASKPESEVNEWQEQRYCNKRNIAEIPFIPLETI